MAKNESSMSKAEIYREERKARIAKAAKQNAKSIEKRNSFAKLAKKIVETTCADKAFFCNSGAEANEGAFKLAKIYFYKKGETENVRK